MFVCIARLCTFFDHYKLFSTAIFYLRWPYTTSNEPVFYSSPVVIFFFVSFTIKKASYAASDGISTNTLLKEITYKEETFINSIIFSSICTRKEIYIKSSRKCLLLLLWLVCGNIESCPGPETMENVLQKKGIKILHQNCRGLFRTITNFTSLFSGERNTV